jgi:ATP-dependent DNA helicase RecQ
MTAALHALKKGWGYPDFRADQAVAVEHILSGRDGLVLMPTGGGKSISFQVPALVKGGLTVVISPLVSLMQDQVGALAGRGIPAFALAGVVDHRVAAFLNRRIGQEPAFLLYMAPERIGTPIFERIIRGHAPSLLVVDEAHCISSWGHDFRPAYRQIALLRQAQGQTQSTQCIALTATATPRVARDICRSLGLSRPFRLTAPFSRPNISFVVRPEVDPSRSMMLLLRSVTGAAIVYDTSREGTEVWAEKLRRAGFKADAYHAGMPTGQRAWVQQQWLRGRTRIVVATNAFGMGIDKPDVRVVAHVGIPDSLESWYQEAGRAGRDGRPALSVVFDSPDARTSRSSLLGKGFHARHRRAGRRFSAMVRWLERDACRNWGVLGYFGQAAEERCTNCDRCRPHLLDEWLSGMCTESSVSGARRAG